MGKCKVQSGNDFYDEILNNRKKLRRYKIYALCIMHSSTILYNIIFASVDQKKIKLPLKEKI